MRKRAKTLMFSEQLNKKLEEFSQVQGLSQSEIVRLALFEFFKRYEGEKDAN
ncbi:MAG: hypothetical protein QXL14_02255 [Candidatus Aenigmatarchaeota archaeon]